MTSLHAGLGPAGRTAGNFEVLDGESCGSGVIVDVDTGKAGDKKLWVEREHRSSGSRPYDQCPQAQPRCRLFRGLKYRCTAAT